MLRTFLAAAALIAAVGSAQAATVVFDEDFDGAAPGLNATDLGGQFTVTAGSVDVIPDELGQFDFYPGNGSYIDLNGSTGEAGTITADAAALGLTVGTGYTLTFSYGINTGSGTQEVLGYGIGGTTGTISVGGSLPATFTTTFVYTGGDLFFADAGLTPGDNGGPLLFEVSIATIPLPAAGLLLLTALGGMTVLRRRKAS